MKSISMAILLAFCLFSCGEGQPPEVNYDFNQETHRGRKAAWEGMEIGYYQFTVATVNHAYSPAAIPISVFVTPGEEPAATVTSLIKNTEIFQIMCPDFEDDPFKYTYGRTITEIFEHIEQRAANLSPDMKATVVYNEEYHYPEKYCEYSPSSAAGGGFSFEIRAFVQKYDKLFLMNELRERKAAWESLGIDHYRYSRESQIDSVSPKPPSTIIVFPDKEPERIISQAEEDWYDRHPGWDWKDESISTISGIFANIERNLPDLLERSDVSIRYNERYHYVEYYNESMKMDPDQGIPGGGWYYFKIISFEDLRE